MSTIVSHVIFMVGLPLETPERIGENWLEGLKGNALKLYQNLLARIPDSFKFQERMAAPANQGFAEMIDPSFVSRTGNKKSHIVDSHGKNLSEAYQKFVRGLNYAFETVDGVQAKRFKEKVEKAKESFLEGLARRALLFGGTKVEGRGPAPLASLWLVNQRGVSGMLREGDQVLQGGPYRICQIQDRSTFKAALTQRLIQAGIRIIKSNFSASVIAEENNQNNQTVQKFIDPSLGMESFATGGASRLDFILVNDQLSLEVQASRV
ncbi:MAG: hypothetical protein HY811_05965 [Planctomycetes bacterium]|nr:hypothetical protein [Planctomycetota bacterium]